MLSELAFTRVVRFVIFVLFSLIAVSCPSTRPVRFVIFVLFSLIAVSCPSTRPVRFVIFVLFSAILLVLSVTCFLNASAKPTLTVGAASVPPTVTVVSLSVPRNWIFGVDVLLKVKSFLVAASAPLIENFAEILVIAVVPSLMLVMTSPVMCFANFALSTPYLMVAPSLATVSPCSSFSTSKVATLLSLSMV